MERGNGSREKPKVRLLSIQLTANTTGLLGRPGSWVCDCHELALQLESLEIWGFPELGHTLHFRYQPVSSPPGSEGV
jgi:hypothetical protein